MDTESHIFYETNFRKRMVLAGDIKFDYGNGIERGKRDRSFSISTFIKHGHGGSKYTWWIRWSWRSVPRPFQPSHQKDVITNIRHKYTCRRTGIIAQTTAPVDSTGFQWNFQQPGNTNFHWNPVESTERQAKTLSSHWP